MQTSVFTLADRVDDCNAEPGDQFHQPNFTRPTRSLPTRSGPTGLERPAWPNGGPSRPEFQSSQRCFRATATRASSRAQRLPGRPRTGDGCASNRHRTFGARLARAPLDDDPAPRARARGGAGKAVERPPRRLSRTRSSASAPGSCRARPSKPHRAPRGAARSRVCAHEAPRHTAQRLSPARSAAAGGPPRRAQLARERHEVVQCARVRERLHTRRVLRCDAHQDSLHRHL